MRQRGSHLTSMDQRQEHDGDQRDQQSCREQLLARQQLQGGGRAGESAGDRGIPAATHEDLVAEKESNGWKQGYDHVRVAQRLGDQRRAEPVNQACGEAQQWLIDASPGGQESKPRRERDAAGDQEVVGDDGTEGRGDRPEHKSRKDHRRVPHEVHAVGI